MDSEKLVWTENLSVNHPKIDAQHRHLFNLINDLASEEATADPKEYARLLSNLTDYFSVHFSEEEAYMQKYEYPELGGHKAEHRLFIHWISIFNSEYVHTVPTGAEVVYLFSRFWLLKHVVKSDMQYRDFIAEKYGDIEK